VAFYMPPFYRWGIKPHPTEEYVSYSSPKNKSAYDILVSLTPMGGGGSAFHMRDVLYLRKVIGNK
jgi:hypothetical protein